MIAAVADTHTALWYLFRNPRLSDTARGFMDDAANAGHDIALSPISLAEIVYLVEKDRLPSIGIGRTQTSAQRSRFRSGRGPVY